MDKPRKPRLDNRPPSLRTAPKPHYSEIMNFSRYILLAMKGCAMGMADVVPGVSGGTIAFISGIYEELLDSIRSVNTTALKLLLKGRFADFWRHINGNFLFSVLAGIAIAIFSLARLMTGVEPSGKDAPPFLPADFTGFSLENVILLSPECGRYDVTFDGKNLKKQASQYTYSPSFPLL